MAFPSSELRTSFGQSSSSFRQSIGNMLIPHRASLCRVEGEEATHVMAIQLEDGTNHELIFMRNDFEFALRLFAIMDTESRGQISKTTVKEFVTLRCPVFWRRDDDLKAMGEPGTSPTFDEVWLTVAMCSVSVPIDETDDMNAVELGVEGWMVFCRFIALAQYLEAKRRFSGRHLQQTMRHRNAPRGSELVMVDVPPPAPPIPLSALQLAQYEKESQSTLPVPELDLDHSLLAAHDVLRRRKDVTICRGRVKVEPFGASPSMLANSGHQSSIEFCLTYYRNFEDGRVVDLVTVRRSMVDLQWLNDTLKNHRKLGGTLCGRILPPFPGKMLSSHYQQNHEDSTLGTTGEALAAAATASVGMIKQGIKSLWGSYLTTPKSSTLPKAERGTGSGGKSSRITMATGFGRAENYYSPNSPICKARQLERYINYLLEHPALSTSFPLNTILKASQSGLEAAKESLDEHTRTAKAIKERAPKMDDGKLGNFWQVHGAGSIHPNLSWVRTAAQAAVALQLHGVLETTGLPSASARLQHASLPKFDNARDTGWSNDEGELQMRTDSDETPSSNEESFEEGVTQVQDELATDDFEDDGEGYDLLPLPVPAPERRILTLSDTRPHKASSNETKEARFRYSENSGVLSELSQEAFRVDDNRPALLGDIAVDENIDKLREVIGSVDNTLSRCMTSSGRIGQARRDCLKLHLDLVRGLDSWAGLRGKFVAQRALLKGVSGIEQSREVFEESDHQLIDDVSWQTALANSAVSAAEDVRSAVRATRTASGARTAAARAAVTAQAACDKGTFKSIDEARAAQTRASIAQSHAIHAAVVEHEAKTVKRKATMALAHDVKCWNAHRKREILQTALSFARSQHEATRRAVDAWSCLRDGYVGPTLMPSLQARRVPKAPKASEAVEIPPTDDVEATIFSRGSEMEDGPPIVAVDHELLKFPPMTTTEAEPSSDPNTMLPFAVASPIPEEEAGTEACRSDNSESASDSDEEEVPPSSPLNFDKEFRLDRSIESMGQSKGSSSPLAAGSPILKSRMQSKGGDDEVLTSSMQSLVNGLMNWGGQYDSEEDYALPTGMAASIALEESGVIGSHTKLI